MSHGPTKIPSRKACIYCGDTETKLTDEHVLPYSMGGRHILLEASCNGCADITKKFEQRVARDLWGDARSSYNAPTRRKKQRKRRFQLRDPRGEKRVLNIPVEDFPAPIIFYEMGRAGILRGDPEDLDRSDQWKLKAIVDDQRLARFEREYPGRMVAQFRHVPDSFGRLLAKIGYCQVLTSLDPNDIEAICVPYILGVKSNLSYIVGGRASYEKPEPGIGYRLSSNRYGTDTKQIVVAEIRIFANCQTPTYHVVVGYVLGEDRVRAMVKKLEARYAVDMPDRFNAPREPPDELHWMPSVWPLLTLLTGDE